MRGRLIVAFGALVSSCAAVTGLGEYELVPGANDASTPAPRVDGSTVDGAVVVADEAGLPDADLLADADVSPDAGADGTAPSTCIEPACTEIVKAGNVLDVAATDTAIYWIDSANNVNTADPAGGGAHAIVTGEQGPLNGVEVANGFLYWGNPNNVRRFSIATNALASFASITGPIGCMKAGDTHLFVSEPSISTVTGIVLMTGKSNNLVASGVANPMGIAVQGLEIYFSKSGTGGELRVKSASTSPAVAPHTVMAPLPNPHCMGFDGANLWWANHDSGTLSQMKATDENKEVVVLTGQTNIHGISVTTQYVYWTWQGGIRRHLR